MTATENTITLGGPYYEDLSHGQRFEDAPGLTLTDGHQALHQAILGDRLRLCLDHHLAAQVTVYCAEINVVLARRLWPRSVIQPPLTEADRASLASQALQNQRREEQQVTVTFDDREPGAPAAPTTPRTPPPRTPPAPEPPAGPTRPATPSAT